MVQFLLSWWSKIFTKQNIIKKSDNYLTISCNRNENRIQINIGDLSFESAQRYGEMLFLLNEGYYIKSISDILIHLSKIDSSHEQFVNNVITNWSNQILNITNDEKNFVHSHIISPTYFYKNSK